MFPLSFMNASLLQLMGVLRRALSFRGNGRSGPRSRSFGFRLCASL